VDPSGDSRPRQALCGGNQRRQEVLIFTGRTAGFTSAVDHDVRRVRGSRRAASAYRHGRTRVGSRGSCTGWSPIIGVGICSYCSRRMRATASSRRSTTGLTRWPDRSAQPVRRDRCQLKSSRQLPICWWGTDRAAHRPAVSQLVHFSQIGRVMSNKNVEQPRGHLKEAAGALTGNRRLKNKGPADLAKALRRAPWTKRPRAPLARAERSGKGTMREAINQDSGADRARDPAHHPRNPAADSFRLPTSRPAASPRTRTPGSLIARVGQGTQWRL
jgi:hypothetical protein